MNDRGSSRRSALAMLVSTMASRAAYGGFYRELKPKADEAIVVCGAHVDNARTLEFWEWGTHKGFTVHQNAVPFIAKAGRYFLRTFTTSWINIASPVYPQPENRAEGIEIVPGTVSYIGDVLGRVDEGLHPYVVSTIVNGGTLVKALQVAPWIEHYPLFMAPPGHEPAALPWAKIHDLEHQAPS